MKNRLNLITEIKSFIQSSLEQYNINHSVSRNEYFGLTLRLDQLNETDFESEEKYKYFLRFINQPQNKVDRQVFESNFTEDRIEVGFLWMNNYFSRMVKWMS